MWRQELLRTASSIRSASASVFAAFREIIPAIIRQIRDPAYVIERKLPDGVEPYGGGAPAAAIAAE